MHKTVINQTKTIIVQARVITELAAESKKWMETNTRLEAHNFELIKGNAVLAARVRDMGVEIRNLRKEIARRNADA